VTPGWSPGYTYASVGTLGAGPNGGGQTIVQLTQGDRVAPRLVSSHPSASCVSNSSAALGLQHDVEAAPKGATILNADVLGADRRDALRHRRGRVRWLASVDRRLARGRVLLRGELRRARIR